MNATYKPQGYTSVAPYLIVKEARKTIEFLEHTFAAVEIRRFLRPDGSIMHAEIRVDDTIVMLADGTSDWQAAAASVHVYVPDVDAAYQRALAAGAISIQEPLKKDDPDKRGGVQDVGGTIWWIATKVE